MSSRRSAAAIESASVAGHFNGHAEALKPSTWHCPMQHVQGSSGSHWVLPSGNYLLHIAPAATMATINKTTMQNVPSLLAVSMAITMRRCNTERITGWRRFVAFIKAPKRHHRASTHSNITNWTCQRWLFRTFHREKDLQLTYWPLITIGVWHIKLMRRT